jgi:hypothetical protein
MKCGRIYLWNWFDENVKLAFEKPEYPKLLDMKRRIEQQYEKLKVNTPKKEIVDVSRAKRDEEEADNRIREGMLEIIEMMSIKISY